MSTTLSTADQLTQSRRYLEEVFADRPRLEQVAEALLQRECEAYLPGFALNVGLLGIGGISSAPADEKNVTYDQWLSLSDTLLKRVMRGRLLNLTAGVHVLVEKTGRGPWVPLANAPSVDEIEAIINRVAPSLLKAFQSSLADYWSQAPLQDRLSSRWRIVANHLRRCLMFGPQLPPLSSDEYQRVLGRFYPVKAERVQCLGPGVLSVYQLYAREEGGAGEWLVVLLIESRAATVSTYYLFSPSSGLQRLAGIEDLASLLPLHMSRHSTGRRVEWAVREPEEDVFDAMAQMLLEKQLRDLAALRWSDFPDQDWYKHRFSRLTAPSVWFGGALERGTITEQALPVWLQGASTQDRLHASRLLKNLYTAQIDAAGADFMDGLEPIHVYARHALQERMRLDYPQEVVINPDDYLLTFTRTQGGTVGWTESISRTLTEWALDNPFVDPYAQVRITNHVEPGYIPDWWFTIAYVKRLIPAVDIGKHYPQLLQRKLLDDPVERRRRERLFVAQVRTQLPLVALENLLRQSCGITRTGLRWIEAAVRLTAQERQVGGDEIVVRPLAFLTQAGSRVYPAANMFVIGPRDSALLPHLLYHPGSAQPLHEWATRQDLLTAIARVGPLQTEVLNSLEPQGRGIFGNGGFLQPHTQRYGQGDEFAPLLVPGPGLLCDQQVPGDFLAYVYSSNAQALVTRAQEQSRSNDAKRWAAFRSELWQLFNVVMPLLRGPLASVGWLYQSMLSAKTLLELPQTGADERRAAAIANAVADLAGILLYPAAGLDERLGLAGAQPQPPATRSAALVRQAANVHELRRNAVADITSMDIGWRSAGSLSPAQQKTLDSYKWRQQGRPWPVTARNIETTGAKKGLVRVPTAGDGFQLHVLIEGGLYPVAETEYGFRVVDTLQPQRIGPWVKRDSAGSWGFDLRLRLRGGGPKTNGAACRNSAQR